MADAARTPKVVLVTFGGRRDRMSLLKRYADAAIERGIIDEWHVWNFARAADDMAWLRRSFPALRRSGNDGQYHLVANAAVPPTAAHTLKFAVRAGHDAHLLLIPRNPGLSYELVLGGWGNSAVGLRCWPAGSMPDHATPPCRPPNLVRPAPALLSARAWRAISIELTHGATGLTIAVTAEGRELLRFTDPDANPCPFDVAVMSGYGAEAEWRFDADATEPAGLFHATPQTKFHHWNAVYQHYVERQDEYADSVFLKCDDDIVYFDPTALADFIKFRRERPDFFLLGANVVNNGVCGAVQQRLGQVPAELMTLEMPAGGFQGSLWESGAKADALHRWFLRNPARFRDPVERVYVPPARFSINFVAWLGADLRHFETRFTDDEADLTTTVPRFLGRENAIYLPFPAAHLSFRPQESGMDTNAILAGYRSLADMTLGSPSHPATHPNPCPFGRVIRQMAAADA